MPMDGVINLYKPAGVSSHDAVAMVRRLAPGVRIGHGGTLDPAATGVLPLCLGRATRIADYLFDLPKGYRAAITLGLTTATGDAVGAVLSRSTPPLLEEEQIKGLFRSLTGRREQDVPAYAAVKYRGRPLYHYARRGEEVPVKRRTVEIYSLELISYRPAAPAQIVCRVECSRGTYIRALAEEMGSCLGCGAHLHALERYFVGPLIIEEAVTLDRLSAAAEAGRLGEMIWPMDRALVHFKALTVSQGVLDDLRAGRAVPWEEPAVGEPLEPGGAPLRIYDPRGRFRALARCEASGRGSVLRTEKFLSS